MRLASRSASSPWPFSIKPGWVTVTVAVDVARLSSGKTFSWSVSILTGLPSALLLSRLDLAAQAHFLALLADPAGLRAHFPRCRLAAGLGRDHEQRRGDVQGLHLRVALQLRRAQGERLLALFVEHDQFEIAQHVVRALGRRCRSPWSRSRWVHSAQLLSTAPTSSSRSDDRRARSCVALDARAFDLADLRQQRFGVALRGQQQVAELARRAMAGAAAGAPVHALARPRRGRWPGRRRSRLCSITRRSGRSSPMNATWSMAMPSRVGDVAHAGELVGHRGVHLGDAQVGGAALARLALARAVTKATAMPDLRSSTRPWPSWTWKALSSRPSLSKNRRPSVSVPSTSKHASRMRAARSRMSAG